MSAAASWVYFLVLLLACYALAAAFDWNVGAIALGVACSNAARMERTR